MLKETLQDDLSIPTYDSFAKKESIFSEIIEVYKYRELLGIFIWREYISSYKRSYLGVLWAILEPLFTMAIMATVFSAIMRRPIENYPIFLFSGLIVWNLFNTSTIRATKGMVGARNMLGRVYIPRTIFVFTSIGANLLNFFVAFVILLIMLPIWKIKITLAILFIPIAILIVILFSLGIGLILSVSSIFFSDIQSIYTIMLRLLLYLSGIFYNVDILPDNLRVLIEHVPTYQMLILFRNPIYLGILPPISLLIEISVWTLLTFFLGLFIYNKFSNQIVNSL